MQTVWQQRSVSQPGSSCTSKQPNGASGTDGVPQTQPSEAQSGVILAICVQERSHADSQQNASIAHTATQHWPSLQ
jgi:hypothetical protein